MEIQLVPRQGEGAAKGSIEGLPNKCPFCHQTITPRPIIGYRLTSNKKLEVFMICPNINCNKSFIGYYSFVNAMPLLYRYDNVSSKGNLEARNFSEIINELSPNFSLIYNQAFVAEQEQLTEICGVGYRKALEFLIKDYAISKHSSEKEKIEAKLLSSCIKDYVNDVRIKEVAKRAVWLGNDHTHYIKKWEGKNLEDLKKLIDLTIHWIEMEALSESILTDMPE